MCPNPPVRGTARVSRRLCLCSRVSPLSQFYSGWPPTRRYGTRQGILHVYVRGRRRDRLSDNPLIHWLPLHPRQVLRPIRPHVEALCLDGHAVGRMGCVRGRQHGRDNRDRSSRVIGQGGHAPCAAQDGRRGVLPPPVNTGEPGGRAEGRTACCHPRNHYRRPPLPAPAIRWHARLCLPSARSTWSSPGSRTCP